MHTRQRVAGKSHGQRGRMGARKEGRGKTHERGTPPGGPGMCQVYACRMSIMCRA